MALTILFSVDIKFYGQKSKFWGNFQITAIFQIYPDLSRNFWTLLCAERNSRLNPGWIQNLAQKLLVNF